MPRIDSFDFEVNDDGALFSSASNVNLLRKLWLDRKRINGADIGPGDPGDFDHGAWHVACHLAGAAGVLKTQAGPAWLQIEHDPRLDEYFAGITVKRGAEVVTLHLDSADGRALCQDAAVLGFIEGTSLGRTSARNVNDPPTLFNLWRRQDFDQPVTSSADGGRVWEHWCTLRDIRPTHRIGTSVVTAYVSLAATLGPRFIATVARGRSEYGHPAQLCAMVEAGLTTVKAATWETKPLPIPASAEAILKLSDSDRALAIAAELPWKTGDQTYFMFERKIGSFVSAAQVRAALKGA